MTTPTYLPTTIYNALIDALVTATAALFGRPELVDRNMIIIGLGEFGDIWPDVIRESAA